MQIRTWNWPLIGYMLILGFGMSVLIIEALEPALCHPGKLGTAAVQQNVVVFRCWEFWLNRYQTLLAAVAALGAAGASIHYVRKQIAQAEQHRQDQIRRDRAAARTMLPLALSAICEYAELSVKSLKQRHAGGPSQPPSVPTEALEQLVATVRTLDVEHVQPFASIAQEIQVHNARISDARGSSRLNEADFQEYVLDAAEVYARASSLFEFARFKSEQLPTELFADEMKSALVNTKAERDKDGPLHKAIDRRQRMYPRRSTNKAADG